MLSAAVQWFAWGHHIYLLTPTCPGTPTQCYNVLIGKGMISCYNYKECIAANLLSHSLDLFFITESKIVI